MGLRKNIKKILGTIIISCMLLTTPVQAAVESFSFWVQNTGQHYTPNKEGSSNRKSYAGQPWSIKVNHISFSKGVAGAGMAYVLYRGSKKASDICWVNSARAKQGYWGAYSGAANYEYYLYGRMDDDLSGSCESYGQWNSDTIGSWF